MSQAAFTKAGDAPSVAGEARWTTVLTGMDGLPRTTTTRGKIAEQHFRSWAEDIVRRVPREAADAREAAFDDYLARLERTRQSVRLQEAHRDAIDKARRQQAREAAQAAKEEEAGTVYLRVYEELGPVWTRQWLRDELEPEVPGIVHAQLNVELTCKALRRGVEELKARRARRQAVRDPVALVVDVAGKWQASRPTLRVPAEEAVLLPVERIAPSR